MLVGIPKESKQGERRVALVPRDVGAIRKLGAEVAVEAGAGASAYCLDEEYAEAGATVASRDDVLKDADVVLTVNGVPDGASGLKRGATLVGFLAPLDDPASMHSMAREGLSLLAVELIPRITRAQSMDALSSMAMIAGYKAVLLAAQHSPYIFPLMMTAAGTLTPAKVFVIGAGVAGLQAIATARRLGALVEGISSNNFYKMHLAKMCFAQWVILYNLWDCFREMWFVDCSSILHTGLGAHIFINQLLMFNRYVCGPLNLA